LNVQFATTAGMSSTVKRTGRLAQAAVTTVQTRSRHNYYITPFGKANFGPGGRSSSSGITATVFGGYGFVGRYFMSELGKFVVVCDSPPLAHARFLTFFFFHDMSLNRALQARAGRVCTRRSVGASWNLGC
jgi:hypothetical protein